ncbi:uncharacterized protein LOC119606893 [Lucilia sericata]|uniref:uncharacterized protein LOC119606893 n=1 Tax=Lucilia sericata TaxID=13632 RepID=UPI0018A86E0E|nr:uncharacterized protein LOC119606893 [Lucilia sericata]
MSIFEKYIVAADELISFEVMLKAEDFSSYTDDAFDFERSELDKSWENYKSIYSDCSDVTIEKKKELLMVQTKHPQVRKTYIRCINIISKAKANLGKKTEENVESAIPNLCGSISVPPCDTGVFHWDYVSWPTFRDMFTAIYINNTRLSPVEKLFYLFRKTDGEARDINRNVALTAENFEIAWNNLKIQYENKRVLINSQLKLLFNLAPCQQESASEIKRLQREINNCMAILKLYNVDINSWDPIFVFQCSSRLSECSLNLWEQSFKNKTEVPKWEELNNFLTDRFHALESVSDIIAINNSNPSGSQSALNSNNNHTSTKVKQFKAHNTKVETIFCKLCKENHKISSCTRFLNMDYRNRVSTLKKFRYCFNCLNIGHMYGDCSSTNGCSKCKRKHHTLMHRDFVNKNNNSQNQGNTRFQGESQNSSVQQIQSTNTNQLQSTNIAGPSGVVQSHHTSVAKKVMLATAWVNIISCGSYYKVRALIDPCSDESFVSQRIQTVLKLPNKPVSAEITGLGGELVSKSSKIANFIIVSLFDQNVSLNIQALVVTRVTGNVPTHTFKPPKNIDLPNLNYADPKFYESSEIDLLLGGDLYPLILRDGVQYGIFESLVAQETIFGWIVTGPTPSNDSSRFSITNYMTKVSIDDQLKKFWELEEVSRRKILSEEDKKCEEIYLSTSTRNSEGRYIVCLPFKDTFSSLGPNRHIALSQYLRNEKVLMRNPEFKAQYDEVLKEYIALGHMEKIENSESSPSYYLPHHGVFKPDSTTTKLRIVFNASSSSSNGNSLNDLLFVGPILQADLVALILKWRLFQFVFNADISKMYRQILLKSEHRQYQKIVFRSPSETQIEVYQLNTVTFGVNCAPFLALRMLLQLADDEERCFPLGSRILRESMYVDDALVGAHSIPDALEARDQLIGILGTAGFELRKWASNSKQILKNLPQEHLLNSSFLSLDDKSNAKTLGVHWNAAEDYFYFTTEKIKFKTAYTKREVLSIIARLFDPAGWLAPVIITAKILMQQMWLDKIDWDEHIKPVALQKWKTFISNYNEIDTIKLDRWVQYTPSSYIEFHGFCDSSELAYAATLYIRIVNGDKVYVNLLIGKTKVAPVKRPSLPRLELCGAVLLANLVNSVIPNFKLHTYNLYLWSDSTIVLAWLRKPPCNWKTFVANRVATILEKVGNKNWFHVASNHNPADLATRGLIPSDLRENKLWWHGPDWLRLNKSSWPEGPLEFETVEESKQVQVNIARSAEREDILDRFSSLPRAYHVIAYIFRFFNLASKSNFRSRTCICTKSAIFLSQQSHFSDEFSCLSSKKKIDSRSPLLTLMPFLDKNGIIRANGRLGSTKCLSYNERHPVILAYTSRLARLYVEFVHNMVLHGGPRLVLNVVRQECWIIKAKNLIKTVIHNCKICVIHRKKLQNQIMAVLPEEKTTLSRPFTNTGVDFAGPFEIKSFTSRYCRITKGYVCLFVCFSTKAIHIEAVSDLSTPAFLAALARFVARRGCPSRIFSDNGRNFVGAARELENNFEKHIEELRDSAVEKYGHQHLEWHFIPAAAPHIGGLWEAGVKSLKMHFKKSAGQMKYTFEEFSTLLAKIESCLNSRPLGPTSDSIDDLSALTPGHFLIGSAILTPAEPEELSSPISIVNRWRKIKALQQEICHRWKDEYLKELHKRNKWKSPQIDLKENDLVVLKSEPCCPTEWRLGRVVKVYHGSDGKVRVADLKTQNGVITRPIHKLVLLPNCTD